MERPKLGEAPKIVPTAIVDDNAVVPKKQLGAMVVFVGALLRYIAGELERCGVESSKDAEP